MRQGPRESTGGASKVYQTNADSELTIFGGECNTGKIASACRLQRRNSQHRDNGRCPSRPLPEATELSLFLYISGASQAAILPLEPRVSACEYVCALAL